jgi:hypothetical protein
MAAAQLVQKSGELEPEAVLKVGGTVVQHVG